MEIQHRDHRHITASNRGGSAVRRVSGFLKVVTILDGSAKWMSEERLKLRWQAQKARVLNLKKKWDPGPRAWEMVKTKEEWTMINLKSFFFYTVISLAEAR